MPSSVYLTPAAQKRPLWEILTGGMTRPFISLWGILSVPIYPDKCAPFGVSCTLSQEPDMGADREGSGARHSLLKSECVTEIWVLRGREELG